MGTFTEIISIMMITVPIFMPVVEVLGIDPIWFCVLMLICLTLGSDSPPFGIPLFAAKGYMPETSMGRIYRISILSSGLFLVTVAACVAFPPIILGFLR